MLLRTAKSCGPDAPTLASSSRSCVGPTGLRQNISADDGGKRARSPGRARHKPLKPLRAGMPGDSGVPVASTPVLSTLHRGLRVQRAPGIPHALLGGGRFYAQLGRIASRDRKTALANNAAVKMKSGSVRSAQQPRSSKPRSSCPDLIRASINLRNKFFSKKDGSPGHLARRRAEPVIGPRFARTRWRFRRVMTIPIGNDGNATPARRRSADRRAAGAGM
jgi:hypothetical protein